jgi:hypothetical protein
MFSVLSGAPSPNHYQYGFAGKPMVTVPMAWSLERLWDYLEFNAVLGRLIITHYFRHAVGDRMRGYLAQATSELLFFISPQAATLLPYSKPHAGARRHIIHRSYLGLSDV